MKKVFFDQLVQSELGAEASFWSFDENNPKSKEMFTDPLFEVRASRGIVKDYAINVSAGAKKGLRIQLPPNEYRIALDMFRNDPMVQTAFDTVVDVVTMNGFDFVSKDEKARKSEIKKARDRFYNELDFDMVLDNIVYSIQIFGDAFLELRRKQTDDELIKGEVVEIWPLETTEMLIFHDLHGEVINYLQRPFNTSLGSDTKARLNNVGKLEVPGGVVWEPEDVIHFRSKWIGSQVYSYAPLESIGRIYSTNVFANHYLLNIFKNLPPKFLFFLKAAATDQKKRFIQNLLRAKNNPHMDIVSDSVKENADIKVERLFPPFDKGLLDILKFLREQILLMTRVPPIWLGLSMGERGIAEAQIFSFETHVRKIQTKVASKINKFLLPALGIENLEFKFNPVSLKSEDAIITNAGALRNMGLTRKGLSKYLQRHGFSMTEDDFEDDLKSSPFGRPEIAGVKKGPMAGNTSNLDQSGASKQGADKTKRMDRKN